VRERADGVRVTIVEKRVTPDELIEKVGALVATNRDREALELTGRYLRDLAPAMTSEQIVQVADLAHMAQMAVDLEEWDAAGSQAGKQAQASPRS
jgi:hypothetical protein